MLTFWQKFYQMVPNQFPLIPGAAWLKTTANQIQVVRTLRYDFKIKTLVNNTYENCILGQSSGIAVNTISP